MYRQLVGDVLAAPRRLDRIDVPNHIRDGHIRRGQLLHITMLRREIRNGCVVAIFLNQVAAAPANRAVGIIVDLAAFHERQHIVQQRGQHAHQARLGLAAQSQQNEIVPRQDGVHHLRHHAVFIAHNARKQRRGTLQLADQIFAEFVLHGPAADAVLGKRAVAESAQSAGQIPGGFSQPLSPLCPIVPNALVLLSISSFARRGDSCGAANPGRRPPFRWPPRSSADTPFAACRYAGQAPGGALWARRPLRPPLFLRVV